MRKLTNKEMLNLLRLRESTNNNRYPDRAGLIGKTVRNRESGDEGTVMFSSFGISIGGINEDGAHWQTLGDDPKVVMESWEVVDND